MGRALYEIGRSVAMYAGYPRAVAVLIQSLELAHALDDRFLTIHAMGRLGICAALQGDVAQAIPLLEESLTFMRQQGDGQFTAILLTLLAHSWLQAGDLIRAERLYDEAL